MDEYRRNGLTDSERCRRKAEYAREYQRRRRRCARKHDPWADENAIRAKLEADYGEAEEVQDQG